MANNNTQVVFPEAPEGTLPAGMQPVYIQQPVVYAQPMAPHEQKLADRMAEPSLVVFSHSTLFYWWPVWAVGFVMALITWMAGNDFQVGTHQVRIHPSNNLGVVFFFVLGMVILISNVTVRGLASALVIVGAALLTVTFAYFGLWDDILGFFGSLTIYINQGAYFWFSSMLFLIWAFATFVFDRMTYWRITPGQVTQEYVFGTASRAYDTQNMTFEKRRGDFFRHWLIGLGSGDLIIHAYSAGQREDLEIPNVLFVGRKTDAIHVMIATKPD